MFAKNASRFLYRKKPLLVSALLLPFVMGCTSLMEKAGGAFDGSAFAEKELAVYRESGKTGITVKEMRTKAGETYITIRTDRIPNLILRASLPETGGTFALSSLYFLSANVSGWNEFRREISGGGMLRVTDSGAAFRIDGTPESLDIEAGKIRRGNTHLTGDRALSALRNRQERILALSAWMRTYRQERTDTSQKAVPDFKNQKEFEKFWKPVIFPELVVSKKRPPVWTRENAAWEYGEDIRWNVTYTERVFPEELWNVRNSGTLLRDWEETPGWIYMEYQWEALMEDLARERMLVKTK